MIKALIHNIDNYPWLWKYDKKYFVNSHKDIEIEIVYYYNRERFNISLIKPSLLLSFVEKIRLKNAYKRWVKWYINRI